MGNYADIKDRQDNKKSQSQSANQWMQDAQMSRGEQQELQANQAQITREQQQAGIDPSKFKYDGTTGSESVRRRGASDQQRVGADTRVRDDASSGTAGATGAGMGAAMSQAAGTQQATAPAQSNAMWQATRQPTDLASVQQRVLQSFTKPVQRGQ